MSDSAPGPVTRDGRLAAPISLEVLRRKVLPPGAPHEVQDSSTLFTTYTSRSLTLGQRQWIHDASAGVVGQLADKWFDIPAFLAMLRQSVSDPDGYPGRAQGDHEKRCFALSELVPAWDRGQADVVDMVRYLKYRFEFAIYPVRRLLKPFPIVLAVEPTSVCNLRCPMCFIVDPRLSRDKAINGMMSRELFEGLIDEAQAHQLSSLVVASRGEPTLHPRLPEMLAYAKAAGVHEIKLNTNATRLTPELSRRLLATDPDLVVFSVDTSDADMYGTIRVGADFVAVLRNIDTFVAIREREFPRSRTATRASFVIFRDDQDADASRRFWLEHVDEVGVSIVRHRLGIYEAPLTEATEACSLLWERVYVWWDGTVNPCDADYLSRLSPGKFGPGTSISDLWTGRTMTTLREQHAAGAKNTCGPCNRCTGY